MEGFGMHGRVGVGLGWSDLRDMAAILGAPG